MTDVDTRIDSLKEDVRAIGDSVVEALARLKRVEKAVRAHDARFDGIDTRLDGIDTRLDGIDTRLDGIDTRLDNHDRRFDQIDAQLAEILTRLPQRSE